MRYYQPIWEALKKDKVVNITANKKLHPRIIKAVTKEKWLDLGYKLELSPSRADLSCSATNSVLTFILTIRRSYKNITEDML